MTAIDCVAHLKAVRNEVLEAAQTYGLEKPSTDTDIIAVSKTRPAEAIEPLLKAGHCLFGENRVQEAQEKWPALKKAYPNSELHLIGPLQSNKTKDALELFDVIQTLDREKLAKALVSEREKGTTLPPLFIQVNTGEEEQKAGVAPKDTAAFVAYCMKELALPVVGLMCIPPVDANPAPHFALLQTLAQENGLEKTSMGMSGDYVLAAAMGASVVRVGSAIFGERG
jgi:hypothetical protein